MEGFKESMSLALGRINERGEEKGGQEVRERIKSHRCEQSAARYTSGGCSGGCGI